MKINVLFQKNITLLWWCTCDIQVVQSSSLSLSPGGFAIFNYGSTKLSAKLRQQLIQLKLTKMQLLLKGDAPYHQLAAVVPYRAVLAGPSELILVHNSLKPSHAAEVERGEGWIKSSAGLYFNFFYLLMGKAETNSSFLIWKTCVKSKAFLSWRVAVFFSETATILEVKLTVTTFFRWYTLQCLFILLWLFIRC